MEEELKKKLDEELRSYSEDISLIRYRLEIARKNQELSDKKRPERLSQIQKGIEIDEKINNIDPESAFEEDERAELTKQKEDHQDNREKTDWSIKVADRAVKSEQEAANMRLDGMRTQLLEEYEEKQAVLKAKVENYRTGKDIEEKRKEALDRVETLSSKEFATSKEDTIARLNAHFDEMRSEEETEYENIKEELMNENKQNLAMLAILRDKSRFNDYVINEWEFKEPEQDNSEQGNPETNPGQEEINPEDLNPEDLKLDDIEIEPLDPKEISERRKAAVKSAIMHDNVVDEVLTDEEWKEVIKGSTPEELKKIQESGLCPIDILNEQDNPETGKPEPKPAGPKPTGPKPTGTGKVNSKNELKKINIGVNGISIYYIDKNGKSQIIESKLSDVKKYMSENKDLSKDPFVEFAIDKYKEVMGKEANEEIAKFSERYYGILADESLIGTPEMQDMVTYDRSNLDYVKPSNVIKRITNRKIYKEMRVCADNAEDAELATIVPDTKGKIRGFFSKAKNRLTGKNKQELITDGSDRKIIPEEEITQEGQDLLNAMEEYRKKQEEQWKQEAKTYNDAKSNGFVPKVHVDEKKAIEKATADQIHQAVSETTKQEAQATTADEIASNLNAQFEQEDSEMEEETIR